MSKRTLKPSGYMHNGGKWEHILIAEKALGKPLPSGAVVHHADGDRSNNEKSNLVICPSTKYHMLLHIRMRAVDAGYPPHYRVCQFCGRYDDPKNMYVKPNGKDHKHRACKTDEKRIAYRARRVSSAGIQ